MSAIVGIYNLNKEPVNNDLGKNLLKALQKYPADHVQYLIKDHIFMGCHAQWITPESIGEQLPFYDDEKQLAITADAIIDNRNELFERLQVKPNHRKSIPDSRLILLAYEKWGEDTPKYLIGDFAFMIWDERKNKLFGARDFSGTRTLYYYKNDHKFAFSTIIEPLFSLPYVNKLLNELWLSEFIAIPVTSDSISVDQTVYKEIYQLPPSHSIKIKDGRVQLTRYTDFNNIGKTKLKSNEEYEEAFCEVFTEAVHSRLRTHKEVGAHLSGGLDSGSVVGFAAKHLNNENKKLHTYSYVPVDEFVDWTHKSRIANERPYIESTVKYVGNINDSYLSFPETNPYSEIDDWLDVMEIPYKFYENSFWLKGIYEQASNEKIGILLNGQRGNWTISWGHAFDYYALLLKRFKLLRLLKEIQMFSENLGANRSRVFKVVGKKAFPNLLNTSSLEQESFPRWINPEFAKTTNVFNRLEEHGIDITGNKISDVFQIRNNQFNQVHIWGLNGTIGSKLSLRHSLLERDPTNDLRVIKFCLSVPEDQYVQNGFNRSLVRRATKNYLPDDIRLNQKFRGIQGADGIQRMKSQWKDFIEEIKLMLTDTTMVQLLNIGVLQNALEKIGYHPKPENIYDFEFKILMRSLILFRFIKRFEGR
ncbi:asparagine synthase-related protein [Metabacillus endolithicus]|uniref:asparagine synthase (glutamine-hydrolyzing) n=1 Tax=Metabacillus endolithicus TaxID=1535204 RepID=A0ABW5BZ01_9BACI|nr:asparagine synthase-related protein [Metabacillus endolithicus]UPG64494.1 asparagine synthase-related protein [Metabacillus endolithicus]